MVAGTRAGLRTDLLKLLPFPDQALEVQARLDLESGQAPFPDSGHRTAAQTNLTFPLRTTMEFMMYIAASIVPRRHSTQRQRVEADEHLLQ